MALIRVTGGTDFDIIAKGDYEVYVEAFDEPEVNGEFERSSLLLRIRDDIEQEFQNRSIYVNLNTNPNIAWKLSNIATAAGIPEGTEFQTLKEYLSDLKGASMKVKLDHREYNGKTYPDVKRFYATSEAPYVLEEDSTEDSLI